MTSTVEGSATALAQRIAALLTEAIQARGHAVLCLSGGKSPVPMFQALRDMPLAWHKLGLGRQTLQQMFNHQARIAVGMANGHAALICQC